MALEDLQGPAGLGDQGIVHDDGDIVVGEIVGRGVQPAENGQDSGDGRGVGESQGRRGRA